MILVDKENMYLVDENMFSYSEFTSLNCTKFTKILLFGHPDLSKNPWLCLFKQTCLFLSSTILSIYLHFNRAMASLGNVLCACLPILYPFVANDYFKPWPTIIGCL